MTMLSVHLDFLRPSLRGTLLILCGLLAGCCKQPDRPLELTLELARTTTKPDEKLWYKLSVKNVGCEPVVLDDSFWFNQNSLKGNWTADPAFRSGTFFEFTGPDGKEFPAFFNWGHHGEFAVWANACEDGTPCPGDRKPGRLAPGASITTTPSLLSPQQKEKWFTRLTGKPLSLATASERAAFEKYWATDFLDQLRRHGRAPDPSVPAGFRILEGWFEAEQHAAPGKYTIKAVFQPRGTAYIREEATKPGFDPTLWGFPRGTRTFRYESNTLEVIVAP